jgi:hypothetical protein
MTALSPRLTQLGDALHEAAARDLAATAPRPRRRSRRMIVALAALAVAVPGGAIAASQLIHTGQVEKSIPAGTFSLIGTHPTCTVVKANVEYHCLLGSSPAPEVSNWKGTVEPTVDATKHVNGGCRSLASDGREWECYVGQAAVDQKIVGQGFLGQYAPSPGRG